MKSRAHLTDNTVWLRSVKASPSGDEKSSNDQAPGKVTWVHHKHNSLN